MGIARLRALTQSQSSLFKLHEEGGRNGDCPIEDIDTLLLLFRINI